MKGQIVGNPPEVRFPTGGVIRTGYLKDDKAYQKYRGHAYHRMLIEELTHIATEDNYKKLIASCRSAVPALRPQVFGTTNPDGTIEITPKDAKLFIAFRKHQETFTAMLSSGLFDIRQGGVQLLFNKDAVLVSISKIDLSRGQDLYRRKKHK
jgi:hypothetical protein